MRAYTASRSKHYRRTAPLIFSGALKTIIDYISTYSFIYNSIHQTFP